MLPRGRLLKSTLASFSTKTGMVSSTNLEFQSSAFTRCQGIHSRNTQFIRKKLASDWRLWSITSSSKSTSSFGTSKSSYPTLLPSCFYQRINFASITFK
jgi:hypothetical protein